MEALPSPVMIPFEALESETLEAMLIDFVTRDGTDYGLVEIATSAKVEALRAQIVLQEAHIVFDPKSETFTILTREAAKALLNR